MATLRALDLFCGAGGATRGLQLAGFHVTGVDIRPQPRYCGDAFLQADAFTVSLDGYDLIWASPPCQRFSIMTNCRGTKHAHPDLIWATRARLRERGATYVIENVPAAPLADPVMLCGVMFAGLRVYRHRHFEASFGILTPPHQTHRERTGRAGHAIGPNGWVSVAGKGGVVGTLEAWRAALGIDWMGVRELAQAIPPAYARFIGEQAITILRRERVA